MGDLRVRLLAGLSVDGLRPAEVGSRKARTVLAALAVPPHQPRPADLLADVVWGDHLPSRPVEQVGVLISRLRGVLGADRVQRTDAGYVLSVDWLDVDELVARSSAAQAHLAAGEHLPARLAATMALDLAKGPLLPEETSPWFDVPRATVARTVAGVGLVAAEAALAAGDPLGAAAAASMGLDHDPYDEAALRLLMRSHALAGRPASALSAYAEVRTRLRDDLGVSPDARTEALHDEILGVEPPSRDPGAGERWDPLVQRARVELASNDLVGARRDAEEAVRRGGGPGALELAGWTAYYDRDFSAALRWAEEAAARSTEPERRASCLTLAARIRHSRGDLVDAETRLQEAVQSDAVGVRAMAQVWLGSLRVHQGRPDEALELARAGAVDAAAIRHPFVMAHSQFGQVYALGQQGRVADALAQLDVWDATLAEMGGAGVRYVPAAANLRAWVLGAIGARDEADECSHRALQLANTLQEPRAHAQLDLAHMAVQHGDHDAARGWLDEVDRHIDDAVTMGWHVRQRLGLLRADLALADGDLGAAAEAAGAVVDDAAARGSGRAEGLARAALAEVRLRRGDPVADEVDVLLRDLAPVAGLERWRVAASLASASGRDPLWELAGRWSAELAAASGARAASVDRWTGEVMARLRSVSAAE